MPTPARRSLTVRIYRWLLFALLPDRFTDAFADEMLAVFTALDAVSRATGSRMRPWFVLAAELRGLLRIALHERRTHRTIRPPYATAKLEENMFDSLAQDLAFAFRALRRSPGFALVALLTLALGVGANTAIFSLVDGVLLKPLQLNDPTRLIALGEQTKSSAPNALGETSPGSFYDWQSHATKVRIAGLSSASGVLTGHGDPQQLVGANTIGGLMEVLGVQPLFGRLITAADEGADAPRTVVLSFDAWHRLFGEDRNVIGTTIDLSGAARTVVGVMPAGFTFPGAPIDFWTPSRFDAQFRANRDQYFIQVVGRLAPNATLAQAQAELSTIALRLVQDWPKYNQGMHIAVAPLRESIVGNVRSRLLVLMGAVGFVLLITCANLGNLLLARASARRREIAVRQALGASHGRIARQLLTESLVLALAGGALGLLIGKVFLKLLLAAQATTNLPRAEEITLDSRVLIFTLLISVSAGLLFGSVPAWQLGRARFTDALREGSRGSAGHQLARGALVISELALAMMLLTGAGLLLRSFALLQRVNPGVQTDHIATFSISPRSPSPSFFATALADLRAVPGVKSVALTSGLPLSGRGIGAWYNRVDRPLPDNVQPTGEAYRVVTTDYFATVGIPLRRGRLFDAGDRHEAPAIIVNEALVKKYYPGENPIGKPVYLGAPDNRFFDSAPIVGVVGDTRDAGLGADALPTVYIPQAVVPKWPGFSVVIRTAGDPAAVIGDARRIFRALDPTLPLRHVQTLDDVLSEATAPARWSTILLGVFAGVALLMAVLGVFGVLSFIVTQRTRELGIRIALGASAARVQRLVIVRGMSLALSGLAAGVIGSLALSRFLSTLLYGITPTDPLTFVGVAALLTGAASLASWLPARRATRVDPIIALRAE